MRRNFSVIACLLMLAIIAASGSIGVFQNVKAHPRSAPEGSSALSALASPVQMSAIVELEGESVIKRERAATAAFGRGHKIDFQSARARAYEADLEAEQNDFHSRAALISPGLQVKERLRKVANALVIEATGTEIAAMAALPGVKRIEPVKHYDLTLSASVPLISASALWERLGGAQVAGEGMKIAIIDSGIDSGNPLFSGAGYAAPPGFPRGNLAFTNNKVIVAKTFLSGNTTPQDENGHGTNVAGIAAGNLNTASPLGAISGVAPRAYLGNYRVFGASGSTSDATIVSALEEALVDGFDVANMSLGAEAGNSLDFLARAVETAVAGGMIVVVAAGNSGSEEMTISSPGIAPSAITVGAATNAHVVGPTVSVTSPEPVAASVAGLGSTPGSGGAPSASLDSAIGPLAYVDGESLDGQNRACGALPANSLNGKVALIERGNCTFSDKVDNAAAAGARAVIVFNQTLSENPESGGENIVNMSVSGTTIPSVFVTRSSGLALREWLRLHPDAQLSIQPIGSGAFASDVIASFSSRGPSSLSTLKPDVTAPGVSIYSGAITALTGGVADPSGFRAVNGTSQATPHIAGAAALVQQLHPSWTPDQVKSALMSSADAAVFSDLDKTNPAGVLNAGAGRVNLARAIDVSATCAPASLSFGIHKLKKKKKKNTYSIELSITSALDGQNTFLVAIEQLDPGEGFTVTSSAESVTLARNGSASVTVTIQAEKKTAEARDYTGYVTLSDPAGEVMRVPFWARYKKKN